MLKTVEGIYQNGQIQLTELPPNVAHTAQVLVLFLESDQLDPGQLRQLIDQLETIAGIQQGFDDVNRGQTRSLESFVQSMQQKYDISS
jgi:hypothetical protein